jgi:putative ABC transport system permease protein
MIKYFSKIAFRYLWHHKTYSGLNYACLAFGFSCAIIAALYILNIYSYDKFHKNYDRLYAVEALVTFFNGDQFPKEYLSASLPDLLKKHAPEIEEITRVAERSFSFVSGDKTLICDGLYADNNFFDVFTFPLIQGNNLDLLSDLNAIAISEPMAMRFFESTDCVGRFLILKDGQKQGVFKISGVFRKVPAQSFMQFDFVIPFSKFLAENSYALEAGASSNLTWIVLKQNIDYKLVNNKIKKLIESQEANLNQELFLFPLKEKILYDYAGGKRIWGEMQRVVIVGAVGLVILLIACFNFINLAIAVNIRRYREAGIKKVVGSKKSIIVYQFLGETLVIILASLSSAALLVNLLLPELNAMLNTNIHLRLLDLRMIAFFISVALFTGLVAGLFPALYLASSTPQSILKGNTITRHSYSILRQSLIVFQFTIPIALIICMMIIKAQDSYMRNYDVGVDKDKLIVLENSENMMNHADAVKTELLAIPGIEGVSYTNCIPSRGARVSNEVSWEGKDVTEKLHFWCINADFDYNKVVKINMFDGRFFDPAFPSDSECYVINDIAAQVMKNDNPLGSTITLDGKKGTIIGVIKDFYAIDLAGPLVPVIIGTGPAPKPSLLVKYSSGTYASITDEIKKVHNRYCPDTPFKATLFRDLASYSNLSLPSMLIGLAFMIALLLACMGLFGLASFTAESRTKEIGIRKTNGATTKSIMGLLLTNYIKWLTISFLIALPIAFILGKTFLARFYFHTPIPLWAFLPGPAIAFVVALSTVSSQTWNVARRNPVEALRYE